jgi:hypothetical protein
MVSTRGRMAALCPAATTEAQLYSVPASTQIDGVLRVCNLTSANTTFRVAHCAVGHGDTAAVSTDWLFYDAVLYANTTVELSIHAVALETIRVASGTISGITFHLSGNRIVTT